MVRKLIILAILIGCTFFPCNFAVSAGAPIPESKVKETIVKHSLEIGVDPALALSLAKKESGLIHEKKSRDGAVGVFQILPSTAKRMGYNPYYLSENVLCALKYYNLMYKKFGSMELALAAYNAGPGNVAKYKGMPPFKETKIFVNKIMTEYKYQKNNPDPAIARYVEKTKSNSVSKAVIEKPVAEMQQNTKKVEDEPNLDLAVEEIIIEQKIETEIKEQPVKKQKRFKREHKEQLEIDDMLTMKSLPLE